MKIFIKTILLASLLGSSIANSAVMSVEYIRDKMSSSKLSDKTMGYYYVVALFDYTKGIEVCPTKDIDGDKFLDEALNGLFMADKDDNAAIVIVNHLSIVWPCKKEGKK